MSKNKYICLLVLFLGLQACKNDSPVNKVESGKKIEPLQKTSLVVLGNVQDAGSPQIGCKKKCCKNLFIHPDPNRMVVSLGIIDPKNKKTYLFEATPDLPRQLQKLNSLVGFAHAEMPDAILLTHAHIGHYTGLMYLGKESSNADSVPVIAMPRMKTFLENNGPWSQLVKNKNIAIPLFGENELFYLTNNLSVFTFIVPHRDEFSETVGYCIKGPKKSALFIPDIDKWEKWDTSIVEMISKVDYAFIDATFYDGNEIKHRDIKQIPHPFVIESMKLFKNMSSANKKKIYFIHMNHTNPLLNENSIQTKTVIKNGFNVARLGMTVEL